jgi:hypothetical protein
MAAILRLEDGRGLYRSALGYSGMLMLISEAMSPERSILQRWLMDMSKRTPPFCEFDLRGLSDADRTEFWAASERAFASLVERHGPEPSWPSNMYAGESLVGLLRMHKSIQAGEPPGALNDLQAVMPFDGKAIDLNEIWEA